MREQGRGMPRRGTRPAPARARSSGIVSALFYCALALVMIVVAVGTFLFVAAPVDILRDQVAQQVKARTGRDLVIAGRSSLSFYPSVGMSFRDVTLSAPPGMSAPPTIQMAGLDVTVSIWPLLSRQIEVQRLVLRQPVIDLRTDARGRRSWDFAALSEPTPVQVAQAAPAPATRTDLPKEAQEFLRGATRSPGGLLANLKAVELRIEGGTVNYADARSAAAERITGIDARVSFRGLANPLAITGQAVVRDEPVDLDIKIASPDRIADGQSSKVDATATGRALKARFDGTWAPAPLQADGTLDIDAPSGEGLARLSGRPGLAALSGLKLSGLMKANETSVAFNTVRIDLAETQASGSLAVEFAGARPFVRANMRVNEIDVPRLQALMATAASQPALPPRPRAQSPASAPAAPAPAPKGIGDLIERTVEPPARSGPQPAGPQVRGFLKRADWSDAPLDFSAFSLLDGEARIASSRVVLTNAVLGPTQGTLTMRAGVLRANFDEVQLYEGRARGIFVLDSTGAAPSFSLNLNADNIAVQPFLRDLADNDRVSGRGRLVLAIAGIGPTERKLMQSLEGKGELVITNGSVAGLDAMQQVLGILQGRQNAGSGRTDFSEASGSVAITAGVARNADLKIQGTGIRITGAGDIDIGQRQIDYLFKPRAEQMAIEVPVRARGPWDDVRYAAELNREKAMEALKEIGRQFNGQNLGDVVRDLTKPGEGGAPSKAQQLLDRFLKR
jgi:AsmA protein